MPHSHNIDYYLARMEGESLAEALADFEDPLDGRSVDLLSDVDLDEDLSDDELTLELEDY